MTSTKAGLRIGELADATGVTAKTVRYYESIGLLPKPPRRPSGYRAYGPADIERLRFITKAKELGLSLADARDILTLHDRGQYPCIHVMALVDRKIAELDRLLEQLSDFRDELQRLRTESEERLKEAPEEGNICGIIERGIHTRGELALVWLETRGKGRTEKRQISHRKVGPWETRSSL